MGKKCKILRWHVVDKKDTPLAQLFEDFLLAKRSAACSGSTVSWYRENLRAFAKFLGTDRIQPALRDFGPDAVRRYTVHLQDRRTKYEGNRLRRTAHEALSSHTVFGYVATLKVFAAWLAAEGYTEGNVLAGVPQPKKRKTVIAALSQDEIARFVACVPEGVASESA
jgi:site-specific recombinase XerD